jgi:hypothetical protein
MVGHPSDGKNVAGAVKSQSIVRVQALPGKDFGVDRREARIARLK